MVMSPRASLREALEAITKNGRQAVLVGGRPLVEIMIERLRQSGITDITIALHHKSEMIRERLGDGARLGVRIGYALEPTPLGTMGALFLLREWLRQPFFVVNADVLT